VEVARYAGAATIKVLPPLCPLRVSAADFGHGADLVDRGRRATAAWLDEGGVDLPHQERFLSLHQHRPSGEADRRLGSGPVRR
jgi:NTE family protein